MFDVEAFYKAASCGEKIDVEEFVNYLKEYENIVLWGAGNLGRAILKKMNELGVYVDAYWDIRYEVLNEVDGIKVIAPYTGYSKENSVIIFCIANVPVSPTLFSHLVNNGWKNVIKGNYILQGIICPLEVGKFINTKVCNESVLCTVCNCDRLNNIVIQNEIHKQNIKQEELVAVDRVHFIINNFCNLKCKHCNRFMNTYPNDRKKNLNVETIKYDIDKVMKAIHSVGVVILFGGEPFLHPDLDDIVETILEKDNFGSLLINTNGVAKMNQKQIEHLKDGRIRVAFSNYLNVLDAQQKKIFNENVCYLNENQVCAQVQNAVPTWVEVSTLEDKKITKEEKEKKKRECNFPYLFVYDHKVFPCDLALSMYDLDIADYSSDYVDIMKMNSEEELRNAIVELRKRTYYQTCSHCTAGCGEVVKAAEQGYDTRYSLPSK